MIDYEEDWLICLIFKLDGSVALRACWYAIPASAFAVILVQLDVWYPDFREDSGLLTTGGSTMWNASMASLLFLIGFRTRQAFSRFWEGTGLLHQMRGEWFDTVSNCVTFSISARKVSPEMQQKVTIFRHTIVRLMSLAHGSALEEISGNQTQLETIDVFGLDAGTLRHLKDCAETHNFNKVEVLLHLVQSLITKALDDGVLKIPAPICSRVYQTISRGFVNLLNTKKITDTKFPFPFVQIITIFLFFQLFLMPVMISATIKNSALAAVFTFLPIFGLFTLNFISIELENPFGDDDNDLPLETFQEEMNNCLLMLLHPNTDLIATTSPNCILDFFELESSKLAGHEEAAHSPSHQAAPKGLARFNTKYFSDHKESGGLGKMVARSRSDVSGSPNRDEASPKTHAKEIDVSESSDPQGSDSRTSKILEEGHQDDSCVSEAVEMREFPSAPAYRETPPVPRSDEPKLIHHQRSAELAASIGSQFAYPQSHLVASLGDQSLITSMDKFNSSLQCWTQLLDEQVKTMGSSFNALHDQHHSLGSFGGQAKDPDQLRSRASIASSGASRSSTSTMPSSSGVKKPPGRFAV